jgi:hypothetical protein
MTGVCVCVCVLVCLLSCVTAVKGILWSVLNHDLIIFVFKFENVAVGLPKRERSL